MNCICGNSHIQNTILSDNFFPERPDVEVYIVHKIDLKGSSSLLFVQVLSKVHTKSLAQSQLVLLTCTFLLTYYQNELDLENCHLFGKAALYKVSFSNFLGSIKRFSILLMQVPIINNNNRTASGRCLNYNTVLFIKTC